MPSGHGQRVSEFAPQKVFLTMSPTFMSLTTLKYLSGSPATCRTTASCTTGANVSTPATTGGLTSSINSPSSSAPPPKISGATADPGTSTFHVPSRSRYAAYAPSLAPARAGPKTSGCSTAVWATSSAILSADPLATASADTRATVLIPWLNGAV